MLVITYSIVLIQMPKLIDVTSNSTILQDFVYSLNNSIITNLLFNECYFI